MKNTSEFNYATNTFTPWGQTETCPHCEFENTYLFWDPKKQGYIAICRNCGEKIFLCDACLHSEDNPNGKCDWGVKAKVDGILCGSCFRGEYPVDAHKEYYITIYADNTPWYTEEELIHSNMVDIKVPKDLLIQWYKENPDLETNAVKELNGETCCGFFRWLMQFSDCDMTEGLFSWLINHGFEPRKEDALRDDIHVTYKGTRR